MTSPTTTAMNAPRWDEQQNPGVRAHCRRVAAWALEIAASVGLPPSDRTLLEQICLLHHIPSTMLNSGSRSRLLSDIAPRAFGAPESAPSMDLVLALLDARRHEARFRRLFEILEAADMFDEQIEMLPFETATLDELTHIDSWDGNPALLTVLPKLRKVTVDQLSNLVVQLPVFPAVAGRAIAMLKDPRSSISELGELTRRDQVIAGELLRVANSSLYSPRFPVTTATQAITRIGVDAARRVILAASMRPVLSRDGIRGLWEHSIETAAIAEHIARLADMNPEEAYLLGLVHDVGKLLFSQLPGDVQRLKDRLIEYGCQPAVVEHLVIGEDHAGAGARVLEHWKFPQAVVEAVRHHHQPERTTSKAAALLYLTEFWSVSEEDIASAVRLHAAEKLLNIRVDDLRRVEEPVNPMLAC